jgi:hypothetical protein
MRPILLQDMSFMPNPTSSTPRALWAHIATATLARAIVAAVLPLGNDEVYYWEFALHPDWSYFDHPPMVGWVIQLFTLNLLLDHELFVRLGPIVFAACNTWLVYRLGAQVHSPRAGFHAALLYTASIYTTIIAGVFILPDTPQLLFWLLSLSLFLRILPAEPITSRERNLLLLAGVTVGLAMLAKYHSVFLWVGAGLYILLFNRRWLLTPHLYLAGVLSGLVFLPVVLWNFYNDFVSLAFQGGRVTGPSQLRPDYFATELIGQIAYQNPVCWALMALALVAAFRGRPFLSRQHLRVLLLFSLPLIALFLYFALSRRTLPHWSGPGYVVLMVLAGAWSAQRSQAWVPRAHKAALGFAGFIAVAGVGVLLFLPMQLGKTEAAVLGNGDATLDFHGWDQVREGFARIAAEDEQAGHIQASAPLISFRWFPGAHLHYYVARPLGHKFLAYGTLEDIHYYAWTNQMLGDIQPGEDAWFIDLSNMHQDPHRLFGNNFQRIETAGTFPIHRAGTPVRHATVYRLLDCTSTPEVVPFKDYLP